MNNVLHPLETFSYIYEIKVVYNQTQVVFKYILPMILFIGSSKLVLANISFYIKFYIHVS